MAGSMGGGSSGNIYNQRRQNLAEILDNLQQNANILGDNHSISGNSQPVAFAQMLPQENHYSDRFNGFMETTLEEEGGYVDNPNLIEQATNRSVTEETLLQLHNNIPNFSDDYSQHVRDLTEDQTLDIYNNYYYRPYRIEEINNDRSARAIFDMYIQSAPNAVGRTVQETLNEMGYAVDVDGVIGSGTINTLNEITNEEEFEQFMETLIRNRSNYLQSLPNYNQFQRGWRARTNRY